MRMEAQFANHFAPNINSEAQPKQNSSESHAEETENENQVPNKVLRNSRSQQSEIVDEDDYDMSGIDIRHSRSH